MSLRIVLVLVVASSCTTTPKPPPGRAEPEVMPAEATVVPARWDTPTAIDVARQRLERNGFMHELPPLLEPGERSDQAPVGARLVTRATLPILERAAAVEQAADCWGEAEVIQVRALHVPAGSELRMSCHTQRLALEQGACVRRIVVGCPRRGDALLGELSLAAIGSM